MSHAIRALKRPSRRTLAVASIVAVAAALAVSSLLTAGGTERAARRALAAGRYARARELARFWLRLRPGAADAHYVLARAALALGRPEEFREGSRRALAAGLSPARRSLLRTLMDVRGGRLAGAEPVLLAAVAAGEGPDPQIDEALAKVYLETFRLHLAEPVLDRWAAEAPTDPKPYLWRAELDRRVRHGPEALVADYRKALERTPRSPEARLGLAEALRASRRYAEAQPEYAAYLGLRPDDPAGHAGAAQAALASGDVAEASRHLDRALELAPDHVETLKLIAAVIVRRGDTAAALSYINRAARITPYEIDVRYTRSLLLCRLGRRAEAAAEQNVVSRLRSEYRQLDELKQRLLRSPGDEDLKAEIGRWMLDHGHGDEGRRWSEDVLRTRPGHPLANAIMQRYYSRKGKVGLANYYRMQAGGPLERPRPVAAAAGPAPDAGP